MRRTVLLVIAAMALVVRPEAGQPGGRPPNELDVFALPHSPYATTSGHLLTAPPGVVVLRGGSGGSLDTSTTRVPLETTMGVNDIATHFARQIASAGWKVEASSADGRMIAAVRLSGRLKSGAAATTLLVVTALAGTPRVDAVLRIVRDKSLEPPMPSRGPTRGRPSGAGANASNVPPGVSPALMGVLLEGSLPGDPRDRVQIIAGMPPGFPKDVMPRGTTVGAAAVSASQTTAVAAAPNFVLSAVPTYITQLSGAGWLSTVPPPRGFLQKLPSVQMCRRTDSLQLDFLPRENGGAFIRATTWKSGEADCRAPRDRAMMDVPIPVLLAPPGVDIPRSGSGGGLDDIQFETRLDTRLSVAAVAGPFVEQMKSAGWQLAGRIDAPPTGSVAAFKSASSTGGAVTAILAVTALPGTGTMDAWLRVVRHDSTPQGRARGRGLQ